MSVFAILEKAWSEEAREAAIAARNAHQAGKDSWHPYGKASSGPSGYYHSSGAHVFGEKGQKKLAHLGETHDLPKKSSFDHAEKLIALIERGKGK